MYIILTNILIKLSSSIYPGHFQIGIIRVTIIIIIISNLSLNEIMYYYNNYITLHFIYYIILNIYIYIG